MTQTTHSTRKYVYRAKGGYSWRVYKKTSQLADAIVAGSGWNETRREAEQSADKVFRAVRHPSTREAIVSLPMAEFRTADAITYSGNSRTAVANALNTLVEDGLIIRCPLVKGRYFKTRKAAWLTTES